MVIPNSMRTMTPPSGERGLVVGDALTVDYATGDDYPVLHLYCLMILFGCRDDNTPPEERRARDVEMENGLVRGRG